MILLIIMTMDWLFRLLIVMIGC